jgi:hypothetical protein
MKGMPYLWCLAIWNDQNQIAPREERGIGTNGG